MTAPEPTPTVEHIDAVARTMQPGAWKFSAAMSKERARIDARRLLTTTDADAIAAIAANLPAEVKIASLTDAEMLAALVRAGVLTEEWALRYEHDTDPTMDDPSGVRTQTSRVASRAIAEQAVATRVPGGTIRNRRAERQYVTRWEVAP